MRPSRWVVGGAVALWAATALGAPQTVLCSVFPIYQIARNVAEGREGVSVELMLPASLGCPHHHALTPQDLRKLARADVLVVNGLGMEEFLGAPVERGNPRIRIIDSSAGLADLIPAEGLPEPDPGHVHGADCDHGPADLNPHLFASPRMSAKLALAIAGGLSAIDPEGAGLYFRNASAYADRMNALADEMAARVASFPNRRIVQPHGAFDYLARDVGLEIVAALQPHGQEPSAAEMLGLLRTLRETGAGAVFTEPQYSGKVGRTLAREAGIPVAELDPGASGPEDAPLDHYETTMRRNLETLAAVLGAGER